MEGGGGNEQGVFERVIDLEDRSLVTASVAVVGRGEDGDNVFLIASQEVSGRGEEASQRTDAKKTGKGVPQEGVGCEGHTS
jgi:hypothetical protein